MHFKIIKYLACLAAVSSLILPGTHRLSAAPPSHFRLRSKCFKEGATIPLEQVYTGAGGKNVSPELSWLGAPKGTLSFALTVFDPDAQHGKGWWHWVQVDIPQTASELWYGDGNSGSHVVKMHYPFFKNSFGDLGYSGPCPPPGDTPHHYVFTLYALNVPTVTLNPTESPAAASADIASHSVGSAVLTGRYGRSVVH
jgi:Raf kinase inhibitor-like YbhB/YbcL family protein